MQSEATTIDLYLETLPAEQRIVLEQIDSMVQAALPNANRSMKYGMPTYQVGEKYFAFNSQKNYFSIYADPVLVKKYKKELKGLDVGKSCVRFTRSEKMPTSVII